MVASLIEVLAVEGDLGRESGCRLRFRYLEPEALLKLGPQTRRGRLESHKGPEGVEQQHAGRL
jgi:hypothetical protein